MFITIYARKIGNRMCKILRQFETQTDFPIPIR